MGDRTSDGWLRWTRWAPFHLAGYVCGQILANDAPGGVLEVLAVTAVAIGAPTLVAMLVTREWPRERSPREL